jgi:Fur family ferric uptake transcriptional regulator
MVPQKSRRNTRQRQVVLEELRKLTSHPTAAELYEIARKRLPKISLGTVYRNLELLAGQGLIRKLETNGAKARFDGDVSIHHHVRCSKCGRVDDAHGVPENPMKEAVTALNGYEVFGFHLEFVGVCPECKRRSASRSAAGQSRMDA